MKVVGSFPRIDVRYNMKTDILSVGADFWSDSRKPVACADTRTLVRTASHDRAACCVEDVGTNAPSRRVTAPLRCVLCPDVALFRREKSPVIANNRKVAARYYKPLILRAEWNRTGRCPSAVPSFWGRREGNSLFLRPRQGNSPGQRTARDPAPTFS